MNKRERSKIARALGAIGGKKRAKNLSKQALSDIGLKGASARWKNHKENA